MGSQSSRMKLLKRYLDQYRGCVRRKRVLEKRREMILEEFDNPLRPQVFDGMPHASGETVGSAAISYRLDEVDTRIKEQATQNAQIMIGVMEVLDYLERGSIRDVMEYRYLDGMRWENIEATTAFSHRHVFRLHQRGLEQLLGFERVNALLDEYERTLLEDAIAD